MKNMSLTPPSLLRAAKKTFDPVTRHHLLIAATTALGFLAFAVFSANSTLAQPSDQLFADELRKNSIKARFDDTTIKQVDALKSRQDAVTLQLPEGRINPFAE